MAEKSRRPKKGSRLVPLMVVAAFVVGFIAYAVEIKGTVPSLQFLEFDTLADLPVAADPAVEPDPAGPKNLYVVAVVKGDPKKTLHFRIFDQDGKEKERYKTSEEVVKNATAEDGSVHPETEGRLARLRGALDLHVADPSDEEVIDIIRDDVLWLAEYDYDAADIERGFVYMGKQLSEELAVNAPGILQAQVKKLWVVFLYSLVPGLFGLIYRRSFWTWFGATFLILFAINLGFETSQIGSIASSGERIKWVEGLLLFMEEAVLILLVAFRLRKETVGVIGRKERWRAILFAAFLVALAVASLSLLPAYSLWRAVEIAALLLLFAYVVIKQTKVRPPADHAKNIVLCIDGTWNEPGQKDHDRPAATNVYKLFQMCKGSQPRGHYNASRIKEYTEPAARRGKPCLKQVALYYQGVGNKIDNSVLGQIFGGAFGLGADAIVERAYLDVVKAYQPGDRIFIFGFSRGAAIARLLAGVIGRRGIPRTLWTLRLFGQHWPLKRSRQKEAVKVDVLGCWDTVGAFGVSKNILGIPFQRINLLKDLTVSLAVKRAYHMVALDETRDSFEPTLMDRDPTDPDRIIEVWFSGNHSNVGGGYATANQSDVTLDFLLKQISSGYAWQDGQTPGDETWGLYLSAFRTRHGTRAPDATGLDPIFNGSIRQSTGAMYAHVPRKLPVHAVIHDSVFERLSGTVPVYTPQSVFNLNKELDEKRDVITAEVGRLEKTGSLKADEVARLRANVERLSLTRWRDYLGRLTFKPVEELKNPPSSEVTPARSHQAL